VIAATAGETGAVTGLTVRLPALVAALVLGVAWIAIFPQPAMACSCRGITTATALRQSDAAFVGRVVSLDQVTRPKPGRRDIRFEVTRVYKGTAFRQQLVASPLGGDGCGLSPQPGSTWLIFATVSIEGDGDDAVNRLRTTLCSGNVVGGAVPRALGPGRAPLDGASDREEQAIQTDASVNRWLGVAGFGVLGVLALGAVGLGLMWRPGRLR
jgi:hypothetical protein